MKKDKFKVGVIGCGRVASLLEADHLRPHPCTHAGAYQEVKETKIVAACDINEERLHLFARCWDVSSLYLDYCQMLEEEELDIISVCTWTDSHAEIVIAASEVGVKGIICEKPIAFNLRDANRMIKVCKKNKTKLIINHERRWDSYYRKAKELIQKGEIGELRTIVGNVLTSRPEVRDWHTNYKNVGGGPLLHDGTHLMDMLDFFAGEPEWVFGHVERRNKNISVEDMASGYIYFKNGVHATVEGGGLRNYFNFELDIQGSLGRILIGNEALGMWIADVSPRYVGFRELKPVSFPKPEKNRNIFVAGVQDIISCIKEDKESISNGEAGRRALELVMAVYESARLGGVKVELPLENLESPLEMMLKNGRI